MAPSRSMRCAMAAWSLAEWRDFNAPWDKRGFDRDASLQDLVAKAEATLVLRNRCSRRQDALYDGLRPLAEFPVSAWTAPARRTVRRQRGRERNCSACRAK
jgi:hypothetical protein